MITDAETFGEQVARVIQMSRESGDTWDLSLNDQAALTAVLQRMVILDEQVQSLLSAAKAVIADGGPLDRLEAAVEKVEQVKRILHMSR